MEEIDNGKGNQDQTGVKERKKWFFPLNFSSMNEKLIMEDPPN